VTTNDPNIKLKKQISQIKQHKQKNIG